MIANHLQPPDSRRPHPSVLVRALLLMAVSLPAIGCGGGQTPPGPSDPDQARQALRTALDAWKNGQGPAALNQGSPPIHVADEDWQNGLILIGYELRGDDRLVGNGLRCPVRLRLRGQRGEPLTRDVVYTVATDPILSVVRRDDA